MVEIKHRPATRDDAAYLVDFAKMAGEGLPDRVWAEMAGPGETLRDVGLRRVSGDTGSFSWRNATISERDGRIAGGLIGYGLPEAPVEIGADFPAAFVPLQELENLAGGSWYVNILGVYPEFRGQGLGAAMLAQADAIAAETGSKGLSIIVFSANPGAERLYRRSGYTEAAHRRMSYPGWRHDGCDAILLVKGR